MSNVNDKATVSLFVNGEQAQQAMDRLSKKADDLRQAMQSALDAGDKKQANKLQRELDRVTKELNKTESAAKGTGIVLNNLANTSMHGLRNALKNLEKQLSMTKPNTEAWRNYAAQIDAVKERISELNEELEGGQSAWEKFKNWSVSAWPAIDLIKQGYDYVISFMREYVDAYAKMDQEMANVRKFTGMTEAQVHDLNEAFKQLDTRSSREQLNMLAQEAGRLGLSSQEDVLGFVRAADKINVALDDLGEGATLTLSKLTDIFGDKERFGVEQSLLKTGSVINELSQSSSAAAPFIANFAERMSGVGIQAKLTVPQIMALGAVLDSTGQKVEASSTAISQVLVRMMQDPAKYAKVAGLEVENFARLLREDANEALLTFLETLNNAGGLDVLAPMFADMGENGSRAISTLTTLANNIDLVRQRQNEANVAFQEGVSIDKEFEVQNTTVQASLEKAQKRFQELRIELGEKLSPLMAHVISSTSALARAISVVVDFAIKHKTAIIILTTAIGSYYVAAGAATLAQKAWNAAILLGRNVVTAFKYTVGLCQVGMIALTHGTKAAGTAFVFLNKTMKANPFGLVISLLSTLVVVVSKLFSKTQDFNSKMQDAVNIAFKYTEQAEKERTELDRLVGALEGAKKGTKEYDKAKQAFLDKYSTYLQGLVDEKGEIIDLEKAYRRLAESIRIANNERGIEEARKTVDDKYFEKISTLQDELNKSLVEYGADQREAARIVMRVVTAISSNSAIDDETVKRINELTINSFDDAPAVIVNSMYDALSVRNTSLNELGLIQRQQRPFGTVDDSMLESMIDYADKAVKGGGGTVLKVLDLLQGTVEFSDATAEEAQQLLEQLQGEWAYRQGSTPSNGGGTVDNIIPPGPTDPSTPDKPDRFAAEKNWRTEQETLARISYYTGETDFKQYTARMEQIAIDFYSKILEREDLTNQEKLQYQADYYEAVNKQTETGNKQLIADENDKYNAILARLKQYYTDRLTNNEMSAEEQARAEETYNIAVEQAELRHLQRMLKLYKEGSAEYLATQQKLNDKIIASQKRNNEKREKEEKRLASLRKKWFGMNQGEKDKEFANQMKALNSIYAAELKLAGDNEAEKLRVKKAYMAAEAALRKEFNQEQAESSSMSYKDAINSSIEWLNSDGGKAVTGAISTVTSQMSAIFSGISSLVQAELDIETAKIEDRYEREAELAQGNSYKLAKLEKKKEADIAKAKNEANKKMFAMQVIQAVAQTATNALNAYGSAAAIPVVGHILAPIAAAMAVAAGMVQVAAIKKQQQASAAQGYSEGGFTKPGAVDEPAGIVHAGEWVASQKLLASPVARPMIEALDYAQRTNTIGSLKAEDVSRSIRANDSLARIADTDGSAALMVAVAADMSRTVADLTNRLREPFVTINTVTGDHGIKQAQDDYSRLISNVTPKSKKK